MFANQLAVTPDQWAAIVLALLLLALLYAYEWLAECRECKRQDAEKLKPGELDPRD